MVKIADAQQFNRFVANRSRTGLTGLYWIFSINVAHTAEVSWYLADPDNSLTMLHEYRAVGSVYKV